MGDGILSGLWVGWMLVGMVADAVVQIAGDGPELAVTYSTLVAGDSPHTVPSGAVRVALIVKADDVTVEGEAVPSGTVIQHGLDGFTCPELDITLTGSGEVLLIEERVA